MVFKKKINFKIICSHRRENICCKLQGEQTTEEVSTATETSTTPEGEFYMRKCDKENHMMNLFYIQVGGESSGGRL